MAQSPDPIEVEDFKLKQLCRLKISEEPYEISKTSALLATSNVFGIVFVGTSDGVLGIKVSDILQLDNDTPSKKTEIVQFPYKKINLPSRPYFLALSSDNLTLLVCIQKSGCPVGLLYDIRGYAREIGDWSPFQEVRLSATDGVSVNDCAWNPTMPELLAVSLSDGSLITVEVKGTQFTLNSLPANTGIQVISWSPKGKQLVAARPGCITQYKPDLKEAKSIQISGNELKMEKPVACGIQWLSTSQFLVAYADQNDDGARPHLFIINSYKNGPTKLIDYDDVCFGNLSIERPFRYTTITLAPWNVILASSATAMEVVVLGQTSTEDAEHPEWTQWTLEDEFRAELPLSADNDETRPVGMTVDTTSQTPIPWGDNNQTLPPMPVLFVLSSSGLLCPFHVINLKKGATPFNQAPQVISAANERKGTVTLGAKIQTETKKPSVASSPLAASTPFAPQSKSLFSKPADENAAPASSFASLAKLPEMQPSKGFFATSNSEPARSSFQESQTPAVLQPTKPAASAFGFTSQPTQPSQAAAKPPAYGAATQSTTIAAKPPAYGTATQSTPIVTKPVQVQPSRAEPDESGIGAARAILNEEITKFAQEMREFKARSSSVKIEIANEEDKQRLMKLTAEMETFGEELVETTKTQDEEVRGLVTELVDLAALLDDARVRHARRKNPRYNHLLKLRPLDPANRRKMDSIESLHIHIDQQLEEASRILDSISSTKPKDQNRKIEIPITQVIYEAMKNNAKVISQLKSRVERLQAQSKEQQLKLAGAALDALRPNEPEETRKWDNDLASLADSLLSTRIKQEESFSNSSTKPVIHQVSPEKQAMLRNVLAQRPVARIRAARPESASESRLLSNLSVIMQQEEKKETALISLESPRPSISKVAPSPVRAQKALAGVGASCSPMSTGKAQSAAQVEDITPPSTPVNFEQKAKALGGQPMISTLALISTSFSQQSPQNAFVNRKETFEPGKSLSFGFGAKSSAPMSESVASGTAETRMPATSKPPPTVPASVSQGFGFGMSVFNQPSTTASASSVTSPSAVRPSVAPQPGTMPTTPSSGTSFSFSTPSTAASVLKTPTTTTTASFFGQPTVTSTSSGSMFGQPTQSSTSSLITKPAAGQSASLSDQKPVASPLASKPLFGNIVSTTTQTVTTAAFTATTSTGFAAGPLSSTANLTTTSAAATTSSSISSSGFGSGLLSSSAFKISNAATPAASSSGSPAFGSFSAPVSTTAIVTSTTTPTTSSSTDAGLVSSSVSTPVVAVTTAPSTSSSGFGAGLFSSSAFATTPKPITTTSAPTSTSGFGTGLFSGSVLTTSNATAVTSTSTPALAFGAGLSSTPAFATSTSTVTAPTTTSSSAFGAGLFSSNANAATPTAPATTSTSTTTSGFGAGLFGSSAFGASTSSTAVTSASSSGTGSLSTPAKTTAAGGPSFSFSTTPATTAPQASGPLFGTPAATTVGSTAPPAGLFKLSTPANAPSTTNQSSAPLFGSAATTTSTPAAPPSGLFKLTSAVSPTSGSAFGKPAGTTTPSPFGNSFGQGLFGQPSAASAGTPSVFGQPTSTAGSSVFGQPAVTNASTGGLFGQPAPSGQSVFGSQPTFGQSSSVFGQSSAQNAPVSSNQPLFGSNAFAPPPNATATTAPSSSSAFGAGLFGGMGLGSAPNVANAQKNVFGGGAVFGNSTPSKGLLGSTSSTAFGAQSPAATQPPAFGSPSSSSFNAFGQSQPAFGGAATFGSPPIFGSRPTFGGGATFGSPVASTPPKPEGSGFGAFAASSNVPSFGGLASSGPTFGSLAQSSNAPPAFGGAAFPQSTPPSFGGSNSFSSWR